MMRLPMTYCTAREYDARRSDRATTAARPFRSAVRPASRRCGCRTGCCNRRNNCPVIRSPSTATGGGGRAWRHYRGILTTGHERDTRAALPPQLVRQANAGECLETHRRRGVGDIPYLVRVWDRPEHCGSCRRCSDCRQAARNPRHARTIVDWPPGVAGMWNVSKGFAGSVTSMMVPLASHAPFAGGQRIRQSPRRTRWPGHRNGAVKTREQYPAPVGILDGAGLIGGATLQIGVPQSIDILPLCALADLSYSGDRCEHHSA